MGAGPLKVRRRQRWWEIFGHCAPSHQGWSPSRRAVLALLAGAFSFSLMTVCVKQLHGRLPVAEVVLGRALVSVVLSGWLVRRAGLDPLGQRRGLLALRGAVGTAALFCVYLGVMRLPLAAATVLQYLYPSVTALLAWAWLGERPGARIALAMTLGWLGVLVMAHPFGGGGPGQTLPPGWGGLGRGGCPAHRGGLREREGTGPKRASPGDRALVSPGVDSPQPAVGGAEPHTAHHG